MGFFIGNSSSFASKSCSPEDTGRRSCSAPLDSWPLTLSLLTPRMNCNKVFHLTVLFIYLLTFINKRQLHLARDLILFITSSFYDVCAFLFVSFYLLVFKILQFLATSKFLTVQVSTSTIIRKTSALLELHSPYDWSIACSWLTVRKGLLHSPAFKAVYRYTIIDNNILTL